MNRQELFTHLDKQARWGEIKSVHAYFLKMASLCLPSLTTRALLQTRLNIFAHQPGNMAKIDRVINHSGIHAPESLLDEPNYAEISCLMCCFYAAVAKDLNL